LAAFFFMDHCYGNGCELFSAALARANLFTLPLTNLRQDQGGRVKLEFGDLWKFVVSVGLTLVWGAPIVLWFLFKEPFDLTLKAAELSTYTPEGQAALRARQHAVLSVITWGPWVALGALLLGLVITGFGFWKWRRSQVLIDEMQEQAAAEKRSAVRKATEDEMAAKNDPDGVDSSSGLPLGPSPSPVLQTSSTPRVSLQKVESAFAAQISKFMSTSYSLQQDMMVANRRVDFVLSGGYLDKDYLIELKYIRKGFNLGWLSDAALQLRAAMIQYRLAKDRSPNTALVVVVEDDAWKASYESLVERARSELPLRQGKDRIALIRRTEIDDLSPAWVSDALGIPVRATA
jgi:hypothetical protein